MLAFSRAVAEGADALELDVRTTADDVPVILHDESLERTTNGRGFLRSLRLDVVRQLDAGRGEKVPELSEVLERFPQLPIILEIKETRATAAVKLMLALHGAQGRVLVSGFEHAAIAPFGEGWLRSASRSEVATFWVAARLGAPRWGKRGTGSYVAFTVPESYGPLRVVDHRFTRLARRMAKPVHVWTVDDPARSRQLRSIGVNGIITNFPARLRAASN